MRLIEAIEEKTEALRARDIAAILGMSVQQIYKMAAKGEIPCFRVGRTIRFDPREVAVWLTAKYPSKPILPINREARYA